MEWLISSLALSWALQENLIIFPPTDHPPSHPKYKTEAKKAKDRARAAAHQQAQFLRNSSESAPQAPHQVEQQQQGAAPVPQHQQQGVSPAVQDENFLPSHQAAPAKPLTQSAAPAASSFQLAATATAPSKAAKHQADSAVQITSANLEPDQPAAPAAPLTEQPPSDDPPQEASKETVPVLGTPEPNPVCKCNNSGSPVMRLRERRYTSLNVE